MAVSRPRPRFRVLKVGTHYAIHSDSPAAAETDGVVLDGLDLAGVRKVVERLKAKGSQVNTKEIE